MKKLSKYFWVAMAMVPMSVINAFADEALQNKGACELVKQLKPVIDTLRTLAFVGAAFMIMGWAWGFIKDGKVDADDVKKKGIGLFVGFFLLLGVGVLFGFLGGETGKTWFGCIESAKVF